MKARLPPRERAARALCRLAGNPEDTIFDGKPTWQSYFPEVDADWRAALWEGDFNRLGDHYSA